MLIFVPIKTPLDSMAKYFRFHPKYALLVLVILIIEICIALYVKNSFIRGTFGDVLVVALIYCFVLTFFRFSRIKTITGTVLFAFTIEFLQLFNLIHLLHLENCRIFTIILGSTFDWHDLLAYVVGGFLVLWIEFLRF